MTTLEAFREIWVVDFEFHAGAGNVPVPVCLVAHELRTGRRIRRWQNELDATCPYSLGPEALFVAYFASAELGCHRVLEWPDPANICDLYVEFSNLRNGMGAGRSLLDAALAFRLHDAMSAEEKERHRSLILSGGPWSPAERVTILDYCESDVRLTSDLFRAMRSHIRVEYALLRGHYMAAVATIEHHGIPIDRPMLEALRTHWTAIKDRLIARIDQRYGVFEGNIFKHDRFGDWLARHGIPWVRLESGRLDLSDDMFRQMARVYPQVSPLRELRHALSQMRLSELAVGADDRNRCLLSPFRANTGRNAPSNSKFVFGPAVWLRQLIRPTPGFALAYVDYSQQEFGIAAALSGDPRMLEAYRSGDPYLAFAKQAGAVPADATKATHGAERDLYKLVSLGVQYGMHSAALAAHIGQSESAARALLQQHRATYQTFWRWSDAAVDFAMLRNYLYTVFDWRRYVSPTTTDRSLRNFPMQANGAECLRLACVYAVRRGIKVIAPVHDAMLIEAPADQIDDAVRTVQAAMQGASAAVLSGFALATDAKVIRYPDRYCDPRGQTMWTTIQTILGELQASQELVHVQSRRSAAVGCRTLRVRPAATHAPLATTQQVHPAVAVGVDFGRGAVTGGGASRGVAVGVASGGPATLAGSDHSHRHAADVSRQSPRVLSNPPSTRGGALDRRRAAAGAKGADDDLAEIVTPFLKWAGGKRWLVPTLQMIWQSYQSRRLVEPFVGAAAVALGLRPARALLNDANPHLMNLYTWIQRGFTIELPLVYDEVRYYEYRDRFNHLALNGGRSTAEAAALFYYLNRTGYNGLCRFNQSGGFNVPFGKYSTVRYARTFAAHHEAFANWAFTSMDFARLSLEADDFVYADPPYAVKPGRAAFTSYGPAVWHGWDDQVRLAEWLARHPGPVVASNQATDDIIDLYQRLGFALQFIEAPRRINNTGDRTPANELLAFHNCEPCAVVVPRSGGTSA